MRRGSISVLVCLLGLWLGGCGEDSDVPRATGSSDTPASSPSSSTPPVPDGPACRDVWVDGADLPRSYRGCVQADSWIRADASHCASGQVLVVFDDRYYGARGAVVNDVGGPLEDDRQYQRALRSCGG